MKMNFTRLLSLGLMALGTATFAHAADAPAKTTATKTVTKTETKTEAKADSKTDNKADAKAESSSALKVAGGTLEFFAIGKPSMLKIHGTSVQLSGTAAKSATGFTAELEIPLDSFETGMKVRNDHLKEKVFETSKFQTAKLSITKLDLPAGKTGELKDLSFSGKLNLHGVDKDVSGLATVNVSDKSTEFSATMEIKMTDFGMTPPEFMGMTIQDQVKVTAKGEAKP